VPKSGVPPLGYLETLEIFSNGSERKEQESRDKTDSGLPCPGQVQDYPRDTEKVQTRRDHAGHKPDIQSQMYS
jgi:hypothetical protein